MVKKLKNNKQTKTQIPFVDCIKETLNVTFSLQNFPYNKPEVEIQ